MDGFALIVMRVKAYQTLRTAEEIYGKVYNALDFALADGLISKNEYDITKIIIANN